MIFTTSAHPFECLSDSRPSIGSFTKSKDDDDKKKARVGQRKKGQITLDTLIFLYLIVTSTRNIKPNSKRKQHKNWNDARYYRNMKAQVQGPTLLLFFSNRELPKASPCGVVTLSRYFSSSLIPIFYERWTLSLQLTRVVFIFYRLSCLHFSKIDR